MNMDQLVTLESILLSVLVALLGFVVWSIKRYIERDDRWKEAMTAQMAKQSDKIAAFSMELAAKRDVDELFGITRKHGERLSSVEARVQTHEAHHDGRGGNL